MTSYQIRDAKGKLHSVPAQRLGRFLWFHFQGRTYALEVEKKRRSSKQQGAASEGDILAPMPGKILKVNVKKGQSVKEGQTLVVMEAMKMEYSLAAGRDGVIESVNFNEGQQVVLGDTLVVLEKTK